MKITFIKRKLSGILFIVLMIPISCKKSTYLQASPNQSNVIPSTLSDFQAILDKDTYMNGSTLAGLVPDFEEAGTDDYYEDSLINGLDPGLLNLYTWNDNIYGYPFADWDFLYRSVFYANEVIDGISKLSIGSDQLSEYNNVKGSALFYRAHSFYHVAQVFAPPYDSSKAGTDPGIPLRLSSDVNEAITRASVKQSYDQIIVDLKSSLSYLPDNSLYATRPTKAAAYALLSRVYLSMGDYPDAYLTADSCLQIRNSLLDYNTVDTSGGYGVFPFSRFNGEVIFHSVQIENTILTLSFAMVDSNLYNSYADNDLRKTLFFGYQPGLGYSFRGSYDNSYELFTGLTTAEVYLTRAECQARLGNASAAMSDLNTLLQKRWVTTTFVPYTAVNAADALDQILRERRKELVFRGTRWSDIRRLNKQGANIGITRVLGGQSFSLQPNSPHYTYLIPPDVIGFNPAMPQNPR